MNEGEHPYVDEDGQPRAYFSAAEIRSWTARQYQAEVALWEDVSRTADPIERTGAEAKLAFLKRALEDPS
jgi:hypothetical protein